MAILNINSNTTMTQVVKTVLQKKYVVTNATNVFAAAAAIKNNADVKLILVDIDNSTLEKLEFIHHIHTSTSNKIKFIVFTTNTNPEINKQFTQAGAKKIFLKPFNPVELVATVDSLIAN